MEVLYNISPEDKEFFITTLANYFVFIKKESNGVKARQIAEGAYNNLIKGLNFDGVPIPGKRLKCFDLLISEETNRFYIPEAANKTRYLRIKNLPSHRVQIKQKKMGEKIPFSTEELKHAEEMKKTLIHEYPNLSRKDLQDEVDNYCRLKIKMTELVESDLTENHYALKNINETVIKLGISLGINEGEKAKEKLDQDRQSIAAMSSEFQRTIDKYPDIQQRLLYKELRILLDKLERQELSRELFILPAFAGMSVEDARQFVDSHKFDFE